MADPREDEFYEEDDAVAPDEPAEDGALSLDDMIEALQAERDDYKDRFMRALADAENARKRADKDRREAQQFGGTRIARDLLPVYDNLHRALSAAKDGDAEANAAIVEGVELTLRELLTVFDRHGVTRIAPDVGDKFDPQMHEAMFEAPVPGTRAGDIIQVSAEGFLLYDRLLRPAKVGVSSMQG